MRPLLAIPIILALAGCATSHRTAMRPMRRWDLRHTRVVATYHSRKPPASIAQCIEDTLGDLGSPVEWPAEGGTSVQFSWRDRALALFQIAPDGTTTLRRLRSRPEFQTKAESCF